MFAFFGLHGRNCIATVQQRAAKGSEVTDLIFCITLYASGCYRPGGCIFKSVYCLSRFIVEQDLNEEQPTLITFIPISTHR